jgi:hypothetical protein
MNLQTINEFSNKLIIINPFTGGFLGDFLTYKI